MKAEQKRRFRFNWIDGIVLILIVAAAAFFLWKFAVNAAGQEKTVQITYQVQVEGLAPESCDEIAKSLPASLVNGGEKLPGKVIAVKQAPHLLTATDEDNNPAWVADAYHKDLIFTIQADVSESGDMITAEVGDQEVRIGKKYTVETECFEMDGTVLAMNR